jgi:hypothetical protein
MRRRMRRRRRRKKKEPIEPEHCNMLPSHCAPDPEYYHLLWTPQVEGSSAHARLTLEPMSMSYLKKETRWGEMGVGGRALLLFEN